MLFCYVLIVQLCALSVLGANKNATNKEDEAVARTLSRIYAGAESGRLIGLFCRARCLKQRELVQKWVRTFNEEFKVSSNDRAEFHFHSYKKALGLPSVDTVLNSSANAVFYFVADQGFQYTKDLDSEVVLKSTLINLFECLWLKRYEHAPIRQIDDYEGLNLLLNEALMSCDEFSLRYLLMVQDLVKCSDSLVVELRRPMSIQTEATLTWRLPGLSNSCRMIVFLHKGSYFEVDKDTSAVKGELFGTLIISRTVSVIHNAQELGRWWRVQRDKRKQHPARINKPSIRICCRGNNDLEDSRQPDVHSCWLNWRPGHCRSCRKYILGTPIGLTIRVLIMRESRVENKPLFAFLLG
ncbi:hypothetical protein M3Y97_00809200 [Aphelenchoides bicaudatus]|nr:hypothetical protein M3Y97_00809200 [Aphelenchoides bicaudatus]